MVNQLRGDVDGLYELTEKTNKTVKETNKTVDRIDRVVRGNDLRLHRLEKTCGRHFGLLLAAARQHAQRLDRVEATLGSLAAQLDQTGSEVTHLGSQMTQLDVVVRQNSQTLDLVVELLQKQQPPSH